MKERNVTVTFDKAREWYNSGNESLKEIALQAFNKNELTYNFKDITSFKIACKVLNLDYNDIECNIRSLSKISKSSAVMFKLNIIRKALNLGQDLHLTKHSSYIYFPYNPFITKNSTYFKDEIYSGKMELIGKIKSKEEEYYVLGGGVDNSGYEGFSCFSSNIGVGHAYANTGFLGCATKEIAEHFSKYFGMLITEAKYADLKDFEIVC